MTKGKIVAVRGVVVDVEFNQSETPKVYDALEVSLSDEKKIVLEVEAIIGNGMVRTVAMSDPHGLSRNLEVINSGTQISVPVGKMTLGRLFNVLGENVDNKEQVK